MCVFFGYVKQQGKQKGEYVEEMARKVLKGLHFLWSAVTDVAPEKKFDA
jgi:hypothetical protein